jgi:hypothetical protein
MKYKGLILALGIMVISFAANAQSSIYFDPNNGVVGYAYGYGANLNAYNNAIYYGAVSPVRVLYVTGKGYGAIALGRNIYGGYVIGTSAGHPTLQEARYYANVGAMRAGATGSSLWIYTTWLDR